MKPLGSTAYLSTLIVGGCLMLPDASQAHHSFATHYDASKSTQISGVVTRWDMNEPC